MSDDPNTELDPGVFLAGSLVIYFSGFVVLALVVVGFL